MLSCSAELQALTARKWKEGLYTALCTSFTHVKKYGLGEDNFLKITGKDFFFFSVLCTEYNKQKEHEKTKIHLIAVKGHCSACLFLFFHTSCLHIDAFWSDSTQAADLCIRIRNRFLPQSLTSCWKISRKGGKSGVLFTLCRKLSQSTIRRFYSASGSTCLCLRENVMSFVYFTDDNMFYLEL